MSDSLPRDPAPVTGVPAGPAPTLATCRQDATPEATTDSPAERTLAAEEPGRGVETPTNTIAGYVVEGELGRGGMGVVYRARQKGLGRLVALKMILHAGHASAEDRLRFEREARSLGELRHPNIVQVFEVGEHDGKPFFSMEHVEGGSLARHLSGTPMPPAEAARLVEQLAAGMQAAHEQGIIHRDLKPANVLLAACGLAGEEPLSRKRQTPVPKITDFGLAKKQDEAGLSASGAIMGTPSYMAPEQAAGRVHQLDARTDVYALGAILYECLTGRPPFRAATTMDTLRQVLTEEPVAPSQFAPRDSRGANWRDLETVCLKCLQKEPQKRYASARALAGDLGRFLRGEPVVARPVGRLERAWRWCRRNPVTASLLSGIALLLMTVATVSAILGQVAANEAEVARLARDREAETAAEERFQRLRAEGSEENARQIAGDERTARAKADDEEKKAKRLLYANQFGLAQSYWDEGNIAAVRDKLDETQLHRDAWEHRYLYTLANHQGQRTLRGHRAGVASAGFSPDGLQIVTAGHDNLFKRWDLKSGKEIGALLHRGPILKSTAWSPDSRQVVLGCEDRTVRLLEPAAGKAGPILRGHTGTVLGVCFSSDGKRVASAGDRTVRVWDAATGKLIKTYSQSVTNTTCVAFSPDDGRLAVGHRDGTMRIWDVATGRRTLTLQGHASEVLAVSFAPDGRRFASASLDRTVRIWDAGSGQEVVAFKGHADPVLCVAFSPDGRRVASGGGDSHVSAASADTSVKVWDPRTGQALLNLKGHTALVSGVCFSPDGTRVVSASWDKTVKVWDGVAGQGGRPVLGHGNRVAGLAFSPGGRRLVSGGWDGAVRVWDPASGHELLTIQGHGERVGMVCFSPDGRRIAAAGDDKTVKVWDAATGQLQRAFTGHTSRVLAVGFCPDSTLVVSGGVDRAVRVWEAATGRERFSIPRAHASEVAGVCFSPDGKRIASAGYDQLVQVWDAESGAKVHTLQGHAGGVSAVQFSPDGRRIATASWDRTVKVWDSRTGQELFTLQGHAAEVNDVSYSADGRRLASASWDRTVKVWDAVGGQLLLTLRQPSESLGVVSFSPDGRALACGGWAGTLTLWDAGRGQQWATFRGHAAPVSAAAFSADGQRAASADVNRVVKVWDVKTGQDLLTLRGHTGVIAGLAFSTDQQRLVTGGADGTARVWDLAAGRELLTLKGHAGIIQRVGFSPDGRRVLVQDRSPTPVAWDLATGRRVESGGAVPMNVMRSPDGRFSLIVEGPVVRIQPFDGDKVDLAGPRWWVDPDYRWHDEQARQAWQAGAWFAAAFHLGRLLRERPWDARLHVQYAHALRQRERHREAAVHDLHALLLDPHVSRELPSAKPPLVMPRATD